MPHDAIGESVIDTLIFIALLFSTEHGILLGMHSLVQQTTLKPAADETVTRSSKYL